MTTMDLYRLGVGITVLLGVLIGGSALYWVIMNHFWLLATVIGLGIAWAIGGLLCALNNWGPRPYD